mmetsp:Transcript_548/g.1263  ORF Transcript_548/g.1263 Transcript_548/m.1263 type:complete len:348 (+) Transcript_548:1273-2316(+)
MLLLADRRSLPDPDIQVFADVDDAHVLADQAALLQGNLLHLYRSTSVRDDVHLLVRLGGFLHALLGMLDLSLPAQQLPEALVVVVAHVQNALAIPEPTLPEVVRHRGALALLEPGHGAPEPSVDLLAGVEQEGVPVVERGTRHRDLETTRDLLSVLLVHPVKIADFDLGVVIFGHLAKARVDPSLQVSYTLREALYESLRLPPLALAMLQRLVPQEVVQFHCLVRRHAVLVLGRLTPDPEVYVPQQLVPLRILGRHQHDVRVASVELPVLFEGPRLDAEVGRVALGALVLHSPDFDAGTGADLAILPVELDPGGGLAGGLVLVGADAGEVGFLYRERHLSTSMPPVI